MKCETELNGTKYFINQSQVDNMIYTVDKYLDGVKLPRGIDDIALLARELSGVAHSSGECVDTCKLFASKPNHAKLFVNAALIGFVWMHIVAWNKEHPERN